jgi:hypothetical protein
MKCFKTLFCLPALFLLVSYSAVSQELRLLKTTYLHNFPSASSIEVFNNRLYIIGDDAPYMIITDTGHTVLDSVRLFRSSQKRISKDVKADLEASFLTEKEGKTYMVAVSSFSTRNRNKILTLELKKNGKAELSGIKNLVFNRNGLKEINIEGAASVSGTILLSNRANTTHKINHLLLTRIDKTGIQTTGLKTINFNLPVGKNVTGVSGLCYLKERDLLLFTASTEDTPNAYTDGAIGESYIGFISNISSKLKDKSVAADKLIPLSAYLGQDSPQKIESIAVEFFTDGYLLIHLAADNDKGSSTLYKMRWKM